MSSASSGATWANLSAAQSTAALSRDGKLLLFLYVFILLGPYLPHFGPIAGRVRLDNFLLPGVALLLLLRCSMILRILVSPSIRLYSAFILWLLAMTAITLVNPVNPYGTPSLTRLVAGIEAYLRPLLILFIAVNVRTRKTDLITLVRFILVASIPLLLIGALQLLPATASTVNDFVFSLYNRGYAAMGAAQQFHSVVSQGSAISVFGQPSTLGMFALLCLGLIATHLLGGQIIRSRSLLWLTLIMVVIGGVASSSKVFPGGVLILAALLLLFTRLPSRLARPRTIFTAVVSISLLLTLLSRLFPVQFAGLISRLDITSFYATYFAARLGSTVDPTVAKLVRTGAVEIFTNHPLTGLGFTVVGKTTDSFLFGILIMGGVIGALIYAFFLVSTFRRLHTVARRDPDQTTRALARVMLYLGIAFLAAAIGFHTFIQDRAGDAYWLIVGLLISPGLRNTGHTGFQP